MEAIEVYQNEEKREQSERYFPVNADEHIQPNDQQELSEERIVLRNNHQNSIRRKFQQKLRDNEYIDLNDSDFDQKWEQISFRVVVLSEKKEFTSKMVQFKKKERKQQRKWMTKHPHQLPFDRQFLKKSMPLEQSSQFEKSDKIIRRRRMKKQKRPIIKIRNQNRLKDSQSQIELTSQNVQQQGSQKQSAPIQDSPPRCQRPQIQLNNHYKIDFDEFLDRRMSDSTGKIDLGVANLSQVVEHAHSHELLTNQIYFQFVSKYQQKVLYQFINWFKKNTLQGWNFNKYKINLIDHRRISTLLVSLFPLEFVLYQPLSLNQKISEFLDCIYRMNQIQYFNFMDQFDNAHKIKWWKPLHVKYFRTIRSLNPQIIENEQQIRPQNFSTILQKQKFFYLKNQNLQRLQITDKKARPQIHQKNTLSKRSLKQMLGYDQLEIKSQYKYDPVSIEQTGRAKKIKK